MIGDIGTLKSIWIPDGFPVKLQLSIPGTSIDDKEKIINKFQSATNMQCLFYGYST